MEAIRILVVGAEAAHVSQELNISNAKSFFAMECYSLTEASKMIGESPFDSIIVSENINGKSALEIVTSLQMHNTSPPIVMLGTQDSSPDEVRHIDLLYYIPLSTERRLLIQLVESVTCCYRLHLDNEQLRSKTAKKRRHGLSMLKFEPVRQKAKAKTPPELVGSSIVMQNLRQKISQVAGTDMSVMIIGETGTGKDIVARILHHVGNKTGEFVKICCPALPEQLLESELFGHEAGAFTGATNQKPGRIELAMNGTVFLDEITEMPPFAQAKLLEVLESKTFTRVGSISPIEVNLSIVAATNIPLNQLFDKKEFRRDLFYRLNQFYFEIPPLRDHMNDIPELTQHFLDKYSQVFEQTDLSISKEFMVRLMQHDWPGNIRELESVIRHFALTQEEHVIVYEGDGEVLQEVQSIPKIKGIHETERQLIQTALDQTKWNRREAAKVLGMSYNTLRRRIATYQLN